MEPCKGILAAWVRTPYLHWSVVHAQVRMYLCIITSSITSNHHHREESLLHPTCVSTQFYLSIVPACLHPLSPNAMLHTLLTWITHCPVCDVPAACVRAWCIDDDDDAMRACVHAAWAGRLFPCPDTWPICDPSFPLFLCISLHVSTYPRATHAAGP